jgi:AraC-like DNA-binding protein
MEKIIAIDYRLDDYDYHLEYRVAVAYINSHLQNEELSVGEVAKVVSLSLGKLEEIFKVWADETAIHCILRLRLEKAAELLKETKAPVNKIAYSLGFSDMPYFNRAFKKHFGVTPLIVRKKDNIFPKKDNIIPKKDYL